VWLRWTRKALNSFDQIVAFIGHDNLIRANSFLGQIKEKTELLLTILPWSVLGTWRPSDGSALKLHGALPREG
jgi:hypothetical protein